MTEDMKPLNFHYDYLTDALIVEGVRYAGEFFRNVAWPDADALYSFERDGDVVTVTKHAKEQTEIANDVPLNPKMLENQAKKLYQAYGTATNFKNFMGDPMPDWEQLPGAIKAAWIATAEATYSAAR